MLCMYSMYLSKLYNCILLLNSRFHHIKHLGMSYMLYMYCNYYLQYTL